MFNFDNQMLIHDDRIKTFTSIIDELIHVKKLEFEALLENSISSLLNYFQHILKKELIMLLQIELHKLYGDISGSNLQMFDSLQGQEIVDKILSQASSRILGARFYNA
ncbi:hypothetical protein [Candidatus Neoehrlichia procyonis]|uniref:Uncharacterized protein n=1 Tax=Candidatus Neoehrlichia procyonis str. RAC413 TaxID=1359163 RepID=A0A0F3NLD5_9RICK|nr:hypothetical protein [Candidatus Neoehrlichia lotoris]KJV68850.1 hypothetical protein NLO413_0218 [Candidatus Neoehrlichia lotoris str. RAC413]